MRKPGGQKLTHHQWHALLHTERSAEQPAGGAEQPAVTTGWYHVCYCWSVITMASFMLARESARTAGQTLFYVQAIDQPLTVLQHAKQSDFFEELFTNTEHTDNKAITSGGPVSSRNANAVHHYTSTAFCCSGCRLHCRWIRPGRYGQGGADGSGCRVRQR